jgi:hypothetical protein
MAANRGRKAHAAPKGKTPRGSSGGWEFVKSGIWGVVKVINVAVFRNFSLFKIACRYARLSQPTEKRQRRVRRCKIGESFDNRLLFFYHFNSLNLD